MGTRKPNFPLPDRPNAWKVGGARRDRTADLLHAMQALSQLSYGPTMLLRAGYDIGVFTKKK